MLKAGLTIVGELELDKPDFYINKEKVRVDYRDLSLKIAPMKFLTIRIPSDYKLVIDKESGLVVVEGVGTSARKWVAETKQFDYTNISYFVTK